MGEEVRDVKNERTRMEEGFIWWIGMSLGMRLKRGDIKRCSLNLGAEHDLRRL